MAGINLPKISAPTTGEVGRLSPMKAPGAPKLVTYKAPKTVAKQTNPYDTFNVADPYNAAKIPSLANSSYASDVANAKTDAAMGYLTQAQRDAQAGNQATESTGIGNALAAQIANIQQATVAQGNASGAALGAQNTATGSSGSGVAGLAGVAAPAGVSAPAVNAVLGTQNAATGNLYGGLQSAALASGAQNAKQAYANEAVNVQNDQLSQQKELASLLAGIASPSAREATYTSANTSVDAANKATELSMYQSLVTQGENAAALGEKKLADSYNLQAKNYATSLGNSTRKALGIAADQTKVATTGMTAAERLAAAKLAAKTKLATSPTARGGSAGLTPAQTTSKRRQDLNAAIKIINTTGGTTTTTTTPVTYSVTIAPVGAGGTVNPLATPKTVSIPASQKDTYKPPAGYKAISPVAPAKTSSSSKTINKPGSYTKYNRAASYLKAQGWSQAQIKSALVQYHP